MEIPSEVYKIVKEATESHLDDINAAVEAAEHAIRKLSCFNALVAGMISDTIRHLTYDYRHRRCQQMRKEAGGYGGPAKVAATSEAYNAICASLFTYCIAGRTLGSLLGSELDDIGAAEKERGDGHYFNARLCAALKQRVPADKPVREALTERQLERLFRRLRPDEGPDEMGSAARVT